MLIVFANLIFPSLIALFDLNNKTKAVEPSLFIVLSVYAYDLFVFSNIISFDIPILIVRSILIGNDTC